MPHTLALIALLPLVGFLFNGFFATALGGHRANERAAGIIGSAFPLAAFALNLRVLVSPLPLPLGARAAVPQPSDADVVASAKRVAFRKERRALRGGPQRRVCGRRRLLSAPACTTPSLAVPDTRDQKNELN